MTRSTIHRDSVEYLNVTVSAPAGVSLSAQPVAIAVVAGSPAVTDWHTAAWVEGTTTARLLVGPAHVALTPGYLNVWVKVTDNPETPVLKAGTITVT